MSRRTAEMFHQAFLSTLLCVALVPLHAQFDDEPVTSCTGINLGVCLLCRQQSYLKQWICSALEPAYKELTLAHDTSPASLQHPATVICLSVGNSILHLNSHFWVCSAVQKSGRSELCQRWLLLAGALLNTKMPPELSCTSDVRKQLIVNFKILALLSGSAEEGMKVFRLTFI